MEPRAGHIFNLSGRCSCGRTWLQCLDQRHRWKTGEIGIAHIGALTQVEVDELKSYADEEEARIWQLITGQARA